MASRKNSYNDIKNLTSNIEIENIINRIDFEIPLGKNPVGKKTKTKQKSETEKAFIYQEKGIKDALKLF